jgi:hypothetical protein
MRAGETTEVDLAAGLVGTLLVRRGGLVNFVMVKKKVKKRRVAGCGGLVRDVRAKKIEEMFENSWKFSQY